MINILHISDIHYGWGKPEEDGLILDAFFEDLKRSLSGNFEENFCVISGDLVHKGENDRQYNLFYDGFINHLIKFVPLLHIVVTPGNHDLNQSYVTSHLCEHQEDIHKKRTETEFNEYVDKETCLLRGKFAPFEKFVQSKLQITDFDLSGYHVNITPEVSLCLLNSAWCSSGGAKDEYGKEINDKGTLCVNTSKLNHWISENRGRTKLLFMHHPVEHLTDDMIEELHAVCRNGINFLFAGHTHSQNIVKYPDSGAWVMISPQLYSKKSDRNGYSVIHIEGSNIVDIQYREWSDRFRKFINGINFTGSEGGKWENPDLNNTENRDPLQDCLQNILDSAMAIYGVNPYWIHRKLSQHALNHHYDNEKADLDYIDLFNSNKSYHIIAPSQFGLTCFAHFLSLVAWRDFRKHWVYVDCKNWTLSNVESDIKKSAQVHKIEVSEIECLLLDNWRNNFRDIEKIALKIKKLLPEKRLVILSHGTDLVSVDLATKESHDGFIDLYMREIRRNDLYSVVNSIDNNHDIAEDHIVVERLNQDLVSLNMHRTPLNSIQFVVAYRNAFERRPVNRTKVMDNILRSVFDNPGTLTYGDEIDDDNCKFIMGFFCQYLISQERVFFTEDEFVYVCKPFVEREYNSTNLNDLLRVLLNNQILEPISGKLQFRMICWLSYFAANRMVIDSDFAEEMLNKKNAIYNSDLIDFFTGISGNNTIAVEKIIESLSQLTKQIYEHLGIDEKFNPFSNIKWKLNESIQGVTKKQLEEKIRSSRMPDDIKDAVADSSFDSVRPYTQQIYTFLDESEARNLMQLLTSASRALRNSEFVPSLFKENLSKSIFNGWEVVMRVLFYISPLMAKNGFGGYGGANFKLDQTFSKDYGECLKQIIVNMPYNIVLWYKNDFYSDKLTPLLVKYLKSHENEIIRHLIALIIASARPRNFFEFISSYIGSIDKNTYFLGDLYSLLRMNYSYDYMNSIELNQTGKLIKSCYMKHQTGSVEPGPDTIAKFDSKNGKLPERKNLEK